MKTLVLGALGECIGVILMVTVNILFWEVVLGRVLCPEGASLGLGRPVPTTIKPDDVK